jgi:hypothetical protein
MSGMGRNLSLQFAAARVDRFDRDRDNPRGVLCCDEVIETFGKQNGLPSYRPRPRSPPVRLHRSRPGESCRD